MMKGRWKALIISEPSKDGEERFSVLKVDLDLRPPAEWLDTWVETRESILEHFGIGLKKVRFTTSRKGWHYWFHIGQSVSYDEMIMLQFMLGDDQKRSWFGVQRKGFKRFRAKFNILFSRKYRVSRTGKIKKYPKRK